MPLFEKVCYDAGRVIGNVIFYTTGPVIAVTARQGYGKFTRLATKVALKEKTREAITENIFKCLKYIE